MGKFNVDNVPTLIKLNVDNVPPLSAFEKGAMTNVRVLLDPKDPTKLKQYTDADIRWRTRNPVMLLADISRGIRLYPKGKLVAEVNRQVMRAFIESMKSEFGEDVGDMAAKYMQVSLNAGHPLTSRTIKMVLNLAHKFGRNEDQNRELARRYSNPGEAAFWSAVDSACRQYDLRRGDLTTDTIDKLSSEIRNEIDKAAKAQVFYGALSEKAAEDAALKAAKRILAPAPALAVDSPENGKPVSDPQTALADENTDKPLARQYSDLSAESDTYWMLVAAWQDVGLTRELEDVSLDMLSKAINEAVLDAYEEKGENLAERDAADIARGQVIRFAEYKAGLYTSGPGGMDDEGMRAAMERLVFGPQDISPEYVANVREVSADISHLKAALAGDEAVRAGRPSQAVEKSLQILGERYRKACDVLELQDQEERRRLLEHAYSIAFAHSGQGMEANKAPFRSRAAVQMLESLRRMEPLNEGPAAMLDCLEVAAELTQKDLGGDK